jgi:hypothetical protein
VSSSLRTDEGPGRGCGGTHPPPASLIVDLAAAGASDRGQTAALAVGMFEAADFIASNAVQNISGVRLWTGK